MANKPLYLTFWGACLFVVRNTAEARPSMCDIGRLDDRLFRIMGGVYDIQ